jgi:hypothetical protein
MDLDDARRIIEVLWGGLQYVRRTACWGTPDEFAMNALANGCGKDGGSISIFCGGTKDPGSYIMTRLKTAAGQWTLYISETPHN